MNEYKDKLQAAKTKQQQVVQSVAADKMVCEAELMARLVRRESAGSAKQVTGKEGKQPNS